MRRGMVADRDYAVRKLVRARDGRVKPGHDECVAGHDACVAGMTSVRPRDEVWRA